jgi:hypothetical protein
MSESYAQWLDGLRADVAAMETGERRASAEKILARLEQQRPQEYTSQSHAALACWRCWHLPCTCGAPQPPSFNDILAVQQRRRGMR